VGQLPSARLVVQRAEWAAGFEEAAVRTGIYNPDDFDLGHDRQLLDGEHDLFGDGSVRVVPTPGHTAGHQSLLIEGRLLLVGDACYTQPALDADVVPPFGHDTEQQRSTYGWLRGQQAGGVALIYSHDAEQWATLGEVL
jgi:glyoxylase-like metal-dependent hydrolase (beta-lactamase superfamily II)